MSLLERILEKEELAAFQEKSKVDSTILPVVKKLLQTKIDELGQPTAEKDFESSSWALRRAYRDGGRHYLLTILKLLEEKK